MRHLLLLLAIAASGWAQVYCVPACTSGPGGGATIPSVTNIINGDGAGNGADSGIAKTSIPTSLTGDVTGSVSGNAIAATVVKLNGTTLSGLATGLLKNTTGTGVPSIASGTDVCGLITLTGDVGTSANCVTAIGNLKVTNAMIAAATIDLTAKVTGLLPTANIATNALIRSFGGSFSNSGNALVAGATSYFTIPYACTISAWNITISPADTATIDIWKLATGTAIPTVSNTITASAVPAISTGTAVHSTTLTGWSTGVNVSANDIIGINLKVVGGTATQATLTVQCNAT